MREFRMKWLDLGVVLLWAAAATVLAVEHLDGRLGLLSLWVMLAVNAAVTMTLVDWASRRLDRLDVTDLRRLETVNRGLSILEDQDDDKPR